MSPVPDGLPTLAAGGHRETEGKACVMEYVSVVTGNAWSDTPPCTAQPIALMAQCVNDFQPDADRQKLVPFIDRLASAKEWDDDTARAMYELCVEKYPSASLKWREDSIAMLWGTAEDLMERRWELDFPNNDMKQVVHHPERGIEFLEAVLTLHESLHPKTEPHVTTPEALAEAKRLIETKALLV
jgi:hypothetical protein